MLHEQNDIVLTVCCNACVCIHGEKKPLTTLKQLRILNIETLIYCSLPTDTLN